MYIVTGAAGFIGSNILKGLNARGIDQIIAVDDLTEGDKFINLRDYKIDHYYDKHDFLSLLKSGAIQATAIFHEGACSDTTERDGRFMMQNNFQYTYDLFRIAQEQGCPLIYASSAAVYGAGPHYIEDIKNERPLNVYGYSKFLFDQVLRKEMARGLKAQVVGLRYFNVYGPHEQHKGRMASVAFHHYNQFRNEGFVRLFGSYDGWGNGEQSRDFISVDDVVAVNLYFLDNPQVSGIFNCGTGRAQPFNDIAVAVINTLRSREGKDTLSLKEMVEMDLIRYIDFPEDLKGRYQSFTQADTTALRQAGFKSTMKDVAQGVADYINELESK